MSVENDIKTLKKSLKNLKKNYASSKIAYTNAMVEAKKLEEAGAPKEEIENAQNEAVFYHKKKDKARVLYDDGKQRLDKLSKNDIGPSKLPASVSKKRKKKKSSGGEQTSIDEAPAMDEGFMKSMFSAATAFTGISASTDDSQSKAKKSKKKNAKKVKESQEKLLDTYHPFYNYSLALKKELRKTEEEHQWKQIMIKLVLEAERGYRDCENIFNGKVQENKRSSFSNYSIHLKLCKTVSKLEYITKLQKKYKEDVTMSPMETVLEFFKALDDDKDLTFPLTFLFDIDITKTINENYKNLAKQFINTIGGSATMVRHDSFDHLVNNDVGHAELDQHTNQTHVNLQRKSVMKNNKYLLDEAKSLVADFKEENNLEESLSDPFAFMLYSLMKKFCKLDLSMKKQTDGQKMNDAIEKYKLHLELLQCVSHMEVYATASKSHDRENAKLVDVYAHYDNIRSHTGPIRFKFEYMFDEEKSAKDNCLRLERHFRIEESVYNAKSVTEHLDQSEKSTDISSF